MSNDISYILKVTDDFSANIRKFKAELGSANQQAVQSSRVLDQAQKNAKFFTQNLVDLGKAAGIYFGANQAAGFAKDVFNTRIQMDGLNASLAAIMPKFDQTKSGTQLAAEEIDYLREATNRLGVSFQEAAPEYMKFLASSKQDLATTRKTFESFAGISRLYGLSAQRFGLVMNALGQMQSKGTVSMEELRQQLGDSLPNALQLFADAAGMSTAQFTKLVGNGQIGAGILTKVSDVINKKWGVEMVAAAKTLGGQAAVLGNQWFYFKNILSDQLAPTFSRTITSLLEMTTGLNSMLGALKDKSKLEALSPGLRVLADAFIGLGKAMDFVATVGEKLAPVFGFVEKVAYSIRDFGASATIAGQYAVGAGQVAVGALWGGEDTESMVAEGRRKIAVAGDARAELQNQMLYRDFNKQKIEIQINHANAPKGTTVEVKKSSTTDLKVGNTVTNARGGAGE